MKLFGPPDVMHFKLCATFLSTKFDSLNLCSLLVDCVDYKYSSFMFNRLEDSTLSATDQVKALEKEVTTFL